MKMALILVVLTTVASAETISFGTGLGTTRGNSLSGTNYVTIPASAWHTAWAGTSWESTQPDSLSPAIPNGTQVDFWFSFSLAGTPAGGDVMLLVDDSARVTVNGVTLVDNIGSPAGVNCAQSFPTCREPLVLDMSAALLSGTNRLDVLVSQDSGAQYGLDVLATANSTVPEPEMLWLIGGALLLIGAVRRTTL